MRKSIRVTQNFGLPAMAADASERSAFSSSRRAENHVHYKGPHARGDRQSAGAHPGGFGAANSLLPPHPGGKAQAVGSTATERSNSVNTTAIGETLPGYAVDPVARPFMPARCPRNRQSA